MRRSAEKGNTSSTISILKADGDLAKLSRGEVIRAFNNLHTGFIGPITGIDYAAEVDRWMLISKADRDDLRTRMGEQFLPLRL